ncbi:S38AA protein, partial [Bombycilla garrulus]|nr:S38AA protein [Bombycilla garrulus]
QQKDGTFAAGGYMPPLRFKALTLAVVFGTMVGGIMIPNVETVLGLTGATMGSLICFICPALIYKKIHKNALCSQIILWIGLGMLVISTYTTLSATEDTPVRTEAAGLEHLDREESKIDQDALKLPEHIPVVEEPEDARDKPKVPEEKEEMEQPQIKVPVQVPEREEEREKAEEKVQLDRPDQGIAVPVGEAHRHEPPVPHDEVIVDMGREREESSENKRALGGASDRLLEEPARLKPQKEALGPKQGKETAAEKQQRGGTGGPVPNLEKVPEAAVQQGGRLPYKDLGPGEAELDAKAQVAVPDGDTAEAADQDKAQLQLPRNAEEAAKSVEREAEPGEKQELPLPERAELLENRNTEEKQEKAGGGVLFPLSFSFPEAGPAKLLDHNVLLQVIKEQQVQQKQLLDQQAKLLAVIEEQHKEIHQQRQEEGAEEKPKPAEAQPELAVPLSRSREDEGPGAKGNTAGKEQTEQRPGQQLPDPNSQHGDTRGELEEPGHRRDIPVAPPKEWKVPLQENDRAVKNPVENRDPLHGDAQRVPAARNHLEKKPLAEDLGGEREAKAGRDVHQKKNFLKAVEAATAPIQREQPGAAKVQGVAGKSLERDSGTDLKAKSLSQVEPKDLAAVPDSSSNRNAAVREQHPREGERQRAAQAEGAGGRQRDPPGHGLRKEEDPREEPRGRQGRGGPSDGADGKPGPQDAPAPKPENGAAAAGDPERDVKPNRELKLQGGLDLRRRRRDLLPPEEEEEEEEAAAGAGGVLIGLNPLPDVKVNDLRGALETRLSGVAEGAQHVVRSRHIQQVTQ